MENKKIILEFNEEQQAFHYNHGREEVGLFGWETICGFHDNYLISFVCDFLTKQHDIGKAKKVKVADVKKTAIHLAEFTHNINNYILKLKQPLT